MYEAEIDIWWLLDKRARKLSSITPSEKYNITFYEKKQTTRMTK